MDESLLTGESALTKGRRRARCRRLINDASPLTLRVTQVGPIRHPVATCVCSTAQTESRDSRNWRTVSPPGFTAAAVRPRRAYRPLLVATRRILAGYRSPWRCWSSPAHARCRWPHRRAHGRDRPAARGSACWSRADTPETLARATLSFSTRPARSPWAGRACWRHRPFRHPNHARNACGWPRHSNVTGTSAGVRPA